MANPNIQKANTLNTHVIVLRIVSLCELRHIRHRSSRMSRRGDHMGGHLAQLVNPHSALSRLLAADAHAVGCVAQSKKMLQRHAGVEGPDLTCHLSTVPEKGILGGSREYSCKMEI